MKLKLKFVRYILQSRVCFSKQNNLYRKFAFPHVEDNNFFKWYQSSRRIIKGIAMAKNIFIFIQDMFHIFIGKEHNWQLS